MIYCQLDIVPSAWAVCLDVFDYNTASLSHLRTMLPESSSRLLPAKATQSRKLDLISLKIPVQSSDLY